MVATIKIKLNEKDGCESRVHTGFISKLKFYQTRR
jgi:hypothetical protein